MKVKTVEETITEGYNLGGDDDWAELLKGWPAYTVSQRKCLCALVWLQMQKRDKLFWLLLISLSIGGLMLGLDLDPLAFAMGLVVMLVLSVLLFGVR